MTKVNAVIEYRVKVKTLHEPDNTTSQYIEYKRQLSRSDCNLKPHQHDYYNSDLFTGMLNHAHKSAIGHKTWCRLSQLPKCVTVDTSKFLATVSVNVTM